MELVFGNFWLFFCVTHLYIVTLLISMIDNNWHSAKSLVKYATQGSILNRPQLAAARKNIWFKRMVCSVTPFILGIFRVQITKLEAVFFHYSACSLIST